MMTLLSILKVIELGSISFKNGFSPKLVLRKFITWEVFCSFALFLYNVDFMQ